MFFNLIRVMTILVFLSWKEREMRSICYCSCNRDAVWVDSLFHPRVLFSVAFKMKLKVPCLVDCSISIPCTHTQIYLSVLFSKAEFWPRALFIIRTAFSSRMKQDGYASFSPVISRLSQYLPVHSFEFSLFLTCASIDDNFSYKKHAYLMNRFYS